MKVLFDHDLFYLPIGGASKYFVMLLKYMPKELWATTPLLSCNEHPCMKDRNMSAQTKKYIVRHYVVDRIRDVIFFESDKMSKIISLCRGIEISFFVFSWISFPEIIVEINVICKI